jgi:hypothetical protein
VLAHQGLVRLWVDLQRIRSVSVSVESDDDADVADDGDALRQTLAILGESVIRPVLLALGDDLPGVGQANSLNPFLSQAFDEWVSSPCSPHGPRVPADTSDAGRAGSAGRQGSISESAKSQPASLSEQAMQQIGRRVPAADVLRTRIPDSPGSVSDAARLNRRLSALGVHSAELDVAEVALVRRVCLMTEDLKAGWGATGAETEVEPGERTATFSEIFEQLSAQVSELFELGRIHEPGGNRDIQRKRLTIYVVASMSEPMPRVVMRRVIRELQAQLLRSFPQLFPTYRDGYNRSLAIVPILWVPNASDPWCGRFQKAALLEEAAIIESVHGLRRDLEELTNGTRCVPQIFVNSLVSDSSTLTTAMAVRQTLDFLRLQSRNEAGADERLRRYASGVSGTDLFSTFACLGLRFPGTEVQEYLSNRSLRGALQRMLRAPGWAPAQQLTEQAKEPADSLSIGMEDSARKVQKNIDTAATTALKAIAERVRRETEDVLNNAGSGGRHVPEAAEVRETLAKLVDQAGQDLVKELTRHPGGPLHGVFAELLDERDRAIRRYPERVSRWGDEVMNAAFAQIGSDAPVSMDLQEATQKFRQKLDLLGSKSRDSREQLAHTASILTRPASVNVGTSQGTSLEKAVNNWQDLARKVPSSAPRRMAWCMGAAAGLTVATILTKPLEQWEWFQTWVDVQSFFVGWLPLGLAAVFAWGFHVALQRRIRVAEQDLDSAGKSVQDILSQPFDVKPQDFASSPLVQSAKEAATFAGSVAERVAAEALSRQFARDVQLAVRVERSVQATVAALRTTCERMGVRPARFVGAVKVVDEDTSGFLHDRSNDISRELLPLSELEQWYRTCHEGVGTDPAHLRRVIEGAGGYQPWRQRAVLTDLASMMAVFRPDFLRFSTQSIAEDPAFQDRTRNIVRQFLDRYHPGIGFNARFRGYEGLDTDGITNDSPGGRNPALLICAPAVAALWSRDDQNPVHHLQRHRKREVAGSAQSQKAMPPGLVMSEHRVDPNSIWLLSIAQGIQTTSMRNLLRYESMHERLKMPDDRLFPFSADWHPTAPQAARSEPAEATGTTRPSTGLLSVRTIPRQRPLNQFSAFTELQHQLVAEIQKHITDQGSQGDDLPADDPEANE